MMKGISSASVNMVEVQRYKGNKGQIEDDGSTHIHHPP